MSRQPARETRPNWTYLEDALLMEIWPRTRKHQGNGCGSAALNWPQVAAEMNARNVAHGLQFSRNFTHVAICNYILKNETRLIRRWGTNGSAAYRELSRYRATLPVPPSVPAPTLASYSTSTSVASTSETSATPPITPPPAALPVQAGNIRTPPNSRSHLPNSRKRLVKERAKAHLSVRSAPAKHLTPLDILAEVCAQAPYLPLKGSQEYEDSKATQANSAVSADGQQELKPLNRFRVYESPYPPFQ